MKTCFWREAIEADVHELVLLSAKGARQLEPGATPQDCDFPEWPSAESAIHCPVFKTASYSEKA